MKYVVLIQARMGSSRLPDKVMADICGKPDVEWVVQRVKKSKLIDEVMVITSIEKENLPIIEKCAQMGVRTFVGSEDDVLDRYYQAARLIRPEYVIRITADCPMYDAAILDSMLRELKIDTDYMTIVPDSFPDGLDTEIMKFSALEESWRNARLASEREHVTLYIKNHLELFNIQEYIFPISNTEHYRWTLDEEKDLEFITAVYKYFAEQGMENDFGYRDVLSLLDSYSELVKINDGIGRNEGLVKSVREDKIVDIQEKNNV